MPGGWETKLNYQNKELIMNSPSREGDTIHPIEQELLRVLSGNEVAKKDAKTPRRQWSAHLRQASGHYARTRHPGGLLHWLKLGMKWPGMALTLRAWSRLLSRGEPFQRRVGKR
jgi:hypothetical protein